MAAIHGLAPESCAPNSEVVARPTDGPASSTVVDDAATSDAQAAARVNDIMTGISGSLHETAIAASKAEIAFRLLMSICNRLLESHREIMRMGT